MQSNAVGLFSCLHFANAQMCRHGLATFKLVDGGECLRTNGDIYLLAPLGLHVLQVGFAVAQSAQYLCLLQERSVQRL